MSERMTNYITGMQEVPTYGTIKVGKEFRRVVTGSMWREVVTPKTTKAAERFVSGETVEQLRTSARRIKPITRLPRPFAFLRMLWYTSYQLI